MHLGSSFETVPCAPHTAPSTCWKLASSPTKNLEAVDPDCCMLRFHIFMRHNRQRHFSLSVLEYDVLHVAQLTSMRQASTRTVLSSALGPAVGQLLTSLNSWMELGLFLAAKPSGAARTAMETRLFACCAASMHLAGKQVGQVSAKSISGSPCARNDLSYNISHCASQNPKKKKKSAAWTFRKVFVGTAPKRQCNVHRFNLQVCRSFLVVYTVFVCLVFYWL